MQSGEIVHPEIWVVKALGGVKVAWSLILLEGTSISSPWFRRGDLLNQPLHPFIVRALPVYLPAIGADLEFVEVKFGQRLEPVEHGFLGRSLQWMVAPQAAMEGHDLLVELEALNHLRQLLERVKRARTISVCDNLPHKQAPVPAEQDALLPLQDRG